MEKMKRVGTLKATSPVNVRAVTKEKKAFAKVTLRKKYASSRTDELFMMLTMHDYLIINNFCLF